MMFDLRSANSIRDAARRMRYRSAVLIALLVGIAVFSAACEWEENFDATFDNRTDFILCLYPSPADAAAGRCLDEVKPHATVDGFIECGDGPGTEKNRIPVIVTVKEGGRQIYQRIEECRTWQASDGKFVIQQRGDDFLVTDPLTDATQSP
jgi:hypothetical protein